MWGWIQIIFSRIRGITYENGLLMNEFKGPRKKPFECNYCLRHGSSTGFVADRVFDDTKVILIKYQPSNDDVNFQQNTIDRYENYLPPDTPHTHLGVVNILRCKGNEKEPKKDLIRIEKACRKYDNSRCDPWGFLAPKGLINFNPNLFIITYDYRTTEKAPAFKVFLRKSIELAFEWSAKGQRPVILSGEEVAELVFSELFSSQEFDRDTSFRSWVGHWQMMNGWPFGKDIKLITADNKELFT